MPPGASDNRPAIRAALEAAEAIAVATADKLFTSVAGAMQAAEAAYTQVAATLMGSVLAILQTQGIAAGKLAKKLRKPAEEHLSNAYNDLFALDGRYPSAQEAAIAHTTGDPFPAHLYPSDPYWGGNPPLVSMPAGPAGETEIAGLPPAVPPLVSMDPPRPPEIDPPIVPDPPGGGGGADACPDGMNPCTMGKSDAGGTYSGPPLPPPPDTFTRANPGAPFTHWPTPQVVAWAMPTPGMQPPGDLKVWEVYLHQGDNVSPTRFLLPPGYCPVTFNGTGIYGRAGVTDAFDALCGARWVDDWRDPGGGGPPADPPGPQVCEIAPAASCGPAGEVKFPKLEKIEDAECGELDAAVQGILGTGVFNIASLLASNTAPGESFGELAKTIMRATTGVEFPAIPGLLNRLGNHLDAILRAAVPATGCDSPQFAAISYVKAGVSLLEQWADVVPDQFKRKLEILANVACQSELPSASETDRAYLADEISREVWECWQKAAGNYLGPARKSMEAGRERPTTFQLIDLYRRGKISKEDYQKAIRANGVLRDDDAKRLFDHSEAWPGISDVVRFMVRDVADDDGDESVVQRFQMDAEFEQKWQGLLVKYGDGLGVTKDLAKYYWRAHWHLPSYTQLSEMMHRLRPGRVKEELQVTPEDVETALKQDDYLPFWVPKLMAIGHRVITRTDAIAAYQTRALPDEELKELYMDEGFTADDAVKMVAIQEQRRRINEVKRSGLPTARTLINQFSRNEITVDDFQAVVDKIKITDEHGEQMIDSAYLARRVAQRKCFIAGVRKQYLRGLIDDSEASAQFAERGFEGEEIGQIMDCWRRDLQARGKEVSGSQLCKMYGQGLITRVAFAQGLRRVGYSQSAAALLVRTCEHDQGVKAAKQAAADQKAAQAAEEKRRKAEEKAAKEAAGGGE